MRKRVIIGTFIAVVAALILFWQLGRASSPQMERFLPADTLAFVEAANLSDQALQLVETQAWKALSEASPELTTGFLLGANYSGLLRANVAAALIRLQVNDKSIEPVAVVLAESDDENFERSVALFLSNQFDQEQPTASTDYRGVSILSYGQDQHKHLSYARIDDLFIFSDREGGLREVIDVVRGGTASLATNPRVVQMRQRLGYTDGFFGFADGQQALHTVQTLQQSRQSCTSQEAVEAEQALRVFGLDSVTAIGGVSSFERGGVVERLRIETRGGGAGVIRAFLNAPARPHRVLSLVPANADRVFVASMDGAVSVYDEIYNAFVQLAHPDEKAKMDAELAELGVSLRDDLLASVGQEGAIIHLPLPEQNWDRAVLIAEVRDPVRLRQSVERVASQHHLSLTEGGYAGRSLMTIKHEKTNHPMHIAFVDNFIAASDNTAAIEAVIDAYQSGNTISTSPLYQEAFAGRSSAPLFTFYGTNEHLLKLMARMLGQAKGTDMATPVETTALFPTVLYGVAEGDGLYIESYSPLGTFPHVLTGLMAHLSKVGANERSHH
ncbi:MAG: DUF3352 domain-containing protein [Acidobacteria bacterium]|nr:DUF3352 domain-containing protein [Acidobacteriota bacterium]